MTWVYYWMGITILCTTIWHGCPTTAFIVLGLAFIVRAIVYGINN